MEEVPKLDNNEHKEMLFQYDKLREEILQNETLSLQLLGATLLLVSAAMGFAFHEKNREILRISIFLGAIVLLFISMYQTIDRLRSTFLIASYMRVFLEEKNKHIKWETRLKKFREEKPDENYNPFTSLLTTYVIIALANFTLILYYTYNASNEDKHAAISLAILSLLILLTMMIVGSYLYDKYARKNKDTFEQTWEKIRNDEQVAK